MENMMSYRWSYGPMHLASLHNFNAIVWFLRLCPKAIPSQFLLYAYINEWYIYIKDFNIPTVVLVYKSNAIYEVNYSLIWNSNNANTVLILSQSNSWRNFRPVNQPLSTFGNTHTHTLTLLIKMIKIF